ncbi:imelysin family protein [Pararhizobium sp. IMCC21322]|uniref:imelysin family protein n=1 Tax=Pararhizobium sp. IMCC21322 TaxID=3067903 RepID=UPI002740AA58|nr:imelysin family protein [Pararhizobium sp. IMCC21322]
MKLTRNACRVGMGGVLLLTTALVAIPAAAETSADAVAKHYADIAQAKYEDSLTTARTLGKAIDALVSSPSAETQQAAKEAWLAARVPYQQSEVYRFGNAIVDDWEGRVNAWPLDEGLIDYVDASYGNENDENTLYAANVIANAAVVVNGESVDASDITPAFLSSTLHEAGEVEANVATGYHAIEFLLWGQDLNGTGPGAGNRPWGDFAKDDDCTNGNCDRRAAYLGAASDLLIADLEEMTGNWAEDGAARAAIMEDPAAALSTILTGMGSLSYGELAGERMKLGLLLGDPEEEHDCFSDNTHNSHLYDAVGIQNVYIGSYTRIDGTTLSGPSLSQIVAGKDDAVDGELLAKLAFTIERMQDMAKRADATEAYDQMIAEGNTEGNAVVQAAIDGLIDQTRSIERAVAALELNPLEIEGSDSLDSPTAVFQ